MMSQSKSDLGWDSDNKKHLSFAISRLKAIAYLESWGCFSRSERHLVAAAACPAVLLFSFKSHAAELALALKESEMLTIFRYFLVASVAKL